VIFFIIQGKVVPFFESFELRIMIPNTADPALAPALFILMFIGIWLFVCIILSLIGGWQKFGRAYHAGEKIDGQNWSSQSGSARFGVGYRRCLNISANRNGLYISVLFLFRLGHPPLFIPWADITTKQEKYLFSDQVCFRFAKVPDVPFRISARLSDKIRSTVGEAWPEKGR
jgi:hypothetical protein